MIQLTYFEHHVTDQRHLIVIFKLTIIMVNFYYVINYLIYLYQLLYYIMQLLFDATMMYFALLYYDLISENNYIIYYLQ